MRIVSESVVDRSGCVIGNDPAEFSVITNKCKVLVASLKTGREYTIERKEEETA